MTTHIAGSNVREVTRQVLGAARTNDFRAIRITLFGCPGVFPDRAGIVTPHRNAEGGVDVNDLAAQVWAIALGEHSDNGRYTDGFFTSGDTAHMITAEGNYQD